MEYATYKITSFDEDLKIVEVQIDGGPDWARIQLQEPYPTTQEELDAQIRPFIPSKAAVAARSAPVHQFSFVSGLVGKERTVKRLDMNGPVNDVPQSNSTTAPTFDEYLKQTIYEVLAEIEASKV